MRQCSRSPTPVTGLRSDRGTTIIELLVAMSLMTLVGAIFTTGFVQVFGVFRAGEAQIAAQQQLTAAFKRLDKEVPYAAAVSSPAVLGGDWYVEYMIGVSTPVCVELRLNTASRQLQRRNWPNVSPVVATPWVPLASGVTTVTAGDGTTVAPFVVQPATYVLNYESLQVTLNSSAGSGTTASTRQSAATWPLLNSTQAIDDVCINGRGTA